MCDVNLELEKIRANVREKLLKIGKLCLEENGKNQLYHGWIKSVMKKYFKRRRVF